MTSQSVADINRQTTLLKADFLAGRVIEVLGEYYRGSGVQPAKETGLKEQISQTLAIFLSDLR